MIDEKGMFIGRSHDEMTEAELKEIEKEIDALPRSWFFHDMAMAMLGEIKRLQKETNSENQQ